MILVDRALERRAEAGRPVRVGVVGAGFMGSAIVRHISTSVPGMTVAAVCCRTVSRAVAAYRAAGVGDPIVAGTAAGMEAAVSAGRFAVCEDPAVLCACGPLDAVVEATGAVEYGAGVALAAIRNGKHIILVNAELDATLGPVLKVRADRAGVILTGADGDQPAATMNLYRTVRGMGFRPVLCGNIKGMLDRYRTPETQAAFAARWGQNPRMVTSFADGSKISCEQAVIANATGMRVARRGMLGPSVAEGTPVEDIVKVFPEETLLDGAGIADYVIGAAPPAGVFVLAVETDPGRRRFLDLFKMGTGPVYCFHTPHHLCHFDVHNTVARAVLFNDAAVAPAGPPAVGVVAAAKRNLPAGTVLDGIGGYHLYGLCENRAAVAREGLLPLGLAEGCRLKRAVRQDEVIAAANVVRPPGRTCDALEEEQRGLADG